MPPAPVHPPRGCGCACGCACGCGCGRAPSDVGRAQPCRSWAVCTTRTSQVARRLTADATEPSRRPDSVFSPRLPTTTRSADRSDAAVSRAAAGSPSTRTPVTPTAPDPVCVAGGHVDRRLGGRRSACPLEAGVRERRVEDRLLAGGQRAVRTHDHEQCAVRRGQLCGAVHCVECVVRPVRPDHDRRVAHRSIVTEVDAARRRDGVDVATARPSRPGTDSLPRRVASATPRPRARGGADGSRAATAG